jgi:hypothetical protein
MDIIDLSPPGYPPRSLVVFRRARKDRRSPQYYARRRVPLQLRKTPRNPYLTKALGAVSIERAKELAWQWWTSTEQKINRQQSLRDPTFSKVFETYLRDLRPRRHGSMIEVVLPSIQGSTQDTNRASDYI